MLRTAICATLLVPSATLVGCEQVEPDSVRALGASLTQLTKSTAAPNVAPSSAAPSKPIPHGTATALLGTFTVGGQTLRVTELDPIGPQTSRITSCGQGVLYATRPDGTLRVNVTGGVGAWDLVTGGTKGTRIACDRQHLYSLSSAGTLFHADTHTNGQLRVLNPKASTPNVWSSTGLSVPAGTDDIQGGMGNIYALVFNETTKVGTLHSSQLRNPSGTANQGTASSWVQLANNLGTKLATGAGSKAGFASITSSLPYRKRNRAFGANPDETLYYNDSLLYGTNSWTGFPNAGLTILSIAADDSNMMYALATDGALGKRLVRFSFTESNCTDGLDNDANGETDAEDANCRAKLATNWCGARSAGSKYCIDRIQNTDGYSHALVTCTGPGNQPTIKAGLCTRGTVGNDSLTATRTNNAPSDAGQYCNVHNADGTWDFEWRGATPCTTLKHRHPGAKIVRAGLYSTQAENQILVKCSNGGVVQVANGTAAVATAYDSVGHTANRCVFTISPRQMRAFQAPFVTSAWKEKAYGGRGYKVGHIFNHIAQCQETDPDCPCTALTCAMDLTQFGNNESGSATIIDMRGHKIATSTDWHESNSYDYDLDEGTPLKSLGYGTVIASRDRDLSNRQWNGTPYQSEIYVRYDIGSNTTYAESFIGYYAHVGVRSVVTGQTVKPGQLLGYSGTTGSSSGPHLHFGLIRLSNTNGRRSGSVASGHAFGYRVPFTVMTTEQSEIGFNSAASPGTVDPYGWRAPAGIDPKGYRWNAAESGYDNVVGVGAWSPALFQTAEEPPYADL